jgi:hypothetical protein
MSAFGRTTVIRIKEIRFETECGIIANALIPTHVRARDLLGRQLRVGGDVFLINGIHHPHPILNGKPVGLQLEQVSRDQAYELLMLPSVLEG